MSATAPELDALRREIDEIDSRLHELLIRRAELGESVGRVKGRAGWPANHIKPGREATILRRLIARHRGPLPLGVVTGIWRELISVNCGIQGPLSVAVNAPTRSVSYWDMSRRHFGQATPMTLHRSAQNVLRAVASGQATIGVLPLPQEGEEDPWWPQIAGGGSVPQVFARLPFLSEPDLLEPVEGLAVALFPPEPSGEDRSLVVLTMAEQISRGRLAELLQQAGLPGHGIASRREAEAGERHLVVLEGFIGREDPRLARLLDPTRGLVRSAAPIGAYATPSAPVGAES